MALYRPIKINFWTDGDMMDYTPEEKYFYLYLLTNPNTSACGIYELPRRKIRNETGYNEETVDKLLKRFIEYGKIMYSPENKEIYIINWLKHNPPANKNFKRCIANELNKVKTEEFYNSYVECAESQGIDLFKTYE